MKAAVLYAFGQAPKFSDFADPVQAGPEQLIVKVRAAAVKNLDKGIASGTHYASSQMQLPRVLGIDGVGVLEDGTRVYSPGITGMLAEKALVDKRRAVKVPAQLDDVTAAALPNAVLGAGGAICIKAILKPGENILINGATGVTGMVAIQIAKHYGAAKVIATGRNEELLKRLPQLGADETISLK